MDNGGLVHATEGFWYAYSDDDGILRRYCYTHDERRVAAHPLSSPRGLRLSAPPIFLPLGDGPVRCNKGSAFTRDLLWSIDLMAFSQRRIAPVVPELPASFRVVAWSKNGRLVITGCLETAAVSVVNLWDSKRREVPNSTIQSCTRAEALDVNMSTAVSQAKSSYVKLIHINFTLTHRPDMVIAGIPRPARIDAHILQH